MRLWVFFHLALLRISLAQNSSELLGADDECASEGCSLEALQLRASAEAQEEQERDEPTLGTVYAMYTYGAVATSKSPLQDLSRPSRNFRGLRCYTETINGASKLTDIAAIFKTASSVSCCVCATSCHFGRCRLINSSIVTSFPDLQYFAFS
mmetsp:Transcript_20021/g.23744  ORF Transcript_20021/g.23744 Transcript_20021/m.23744 type:complete len:152 (+) Transcript_20021:102-557(+)